MGTCVVPGSLVAAARFKAETLQAKERAMESLHAEQRRAHMREARLAQQRRLQVQNQGYSQRIVDALRTQVKDLAALALAHGADPAAVDAIRNRSPPKG